MLVEHEFVTTLEEPEALRRAAEFLAQVGFAAKPNTAFSMDGGASPAFRRGRANAQRARAISQLPQQVRIQYDRGRVTLAVSIQLPGRGGKEPDALSSKARLHRELLLSVARGLENVLAHDWPLDAALEEWGQVETQIRREAQDRRRRSQVLWGTVIALIVGFIIFIIVMSSLD